jgi:poly(3-hydroxybutyrate) depolymerase
MKSLVHACAVFGAAVILHFASMAGEHPQLRIDGKDRSYLLERPLGPGPRPTIIMLHGLNGSGADIARTSVLDQLVPQSGWVAVFPDRQLGDGHQRHHDGPARVHIHQHLYQRRPGTGSAKR